MKRVIMTLGVLLGTPALAYDDCVNQHLEIATDSVRIEADGLAYYRLVIANNFDFPIGGVVVEHALWANNRPSALGEGYSQFSHTLGGGVLPGERTEVIEYVSIYDREAALARAAESLEVRFKLVAVADIENRIIGPGEDPYGMYSEVHSPFGCRPD